MILGHTFPRAHCRPVVLARIPLFVIWILFSAALASADEWDEPAAVQARAQLEVLEIPYSASTLYSAAYDGDTEVVLLFLAAGPNLDIRDYSGMTALHGAALAGRADVVALLLERGADPNIRDAGDETPIMLAAKYGWYEINDHPRLRSSSRHTWSSARRSC